MAHIRKENFIYKRDVAYQFEHYTDDELSKVLQYHNGAKVRKALRILKDNKLNVFQ